MKRFLQVILLLLLLPATGFCVNVEYMDTNGVTPVKVSASKPLPVNASVSIGSMTVTTTVGTYTPPIQAGTSTIGSIGAIINPLPAGTNSIGSVIVSSMPASVVTPPFVNSSMVATSALLAADSSQYVTIANTNSVTSGLVYSNTLTIATSSFTVLTNITSGTVAPFTIMLQNTGSGKLFKSIGSTGFTATDTAPYIAAGDSWGLYVSTNTVNVGIIASGSTGTLAVEIIK